MTEIKRWMSKYLDKQDTLLTEFRREFEDQPYMALLYADRVFRAVALRDELRACLTTLAAAKDGNFDGVEHIKARLNREIRASARGMNSSTSPCANLLAQCRLSAQIELLRELELQLEDSEQ